MHGAVALFYAKLLANKLLVTFDDVTRSHDCYIAKFAASGMVMTDVIYDRGCYINDICENEQVFPH